MTAVSACLFHRELSREGALRCAGEEKLKERESGRHGFVPARSPRLPTGAWEKRGFGVGRVYTRGRRDVKGKRAAGGLFFGSGETRP